MTLIIAVLALLLPHPRMLELSFRSLAKYTCVERDIAYPGVRVGFFGEKRAAWYTLVRVSGDFPASLTITSCVRASDVVSVRLCALDATFAHRKIETSVSVVAFLQQL